MKIKQQKSYLMTTKNLKKTKTMNITEEQIKKIASQEIDIKDLFPEVFNFTGWAKDKRKISENWLGYFENNILEYGINNSGVWFNTDNGTQYNPNIERPATHEEIKNALVKEAKRRGYEFDFYQFINNVLWTGTEEKGSWVIFDNGNWLEVSKKLEEVKDPTDYKVKYFDACIEIEKLKNAIEKLIFN